MSTDFQSSGIAVGAVPEYVTVVKHKMLWKAACRLLAENAVFEASTFPSASPLSPRVVTTVTKEGIMQGQTKCL